MNHVIRSRAVAAALSMLLYFPMPLVARAEGGCPGCASNSPVINSFAIMWLRGLNMPVQKDDSDCGQDTSGAMVGIAANNQTGMSGYQLVVVKDGKILCQGEQLVGIAFRLSSEYGEPAIIRHVGVTTVTPDYEGGIICDRGTKRYMYFVAPAQRPEESLCHNQLRDGIWRKAWRRASKYTIPDFKKPALSGGQKLPRFEIFKDRLMDYAVIVPNAEYDSDGEPEVGLVRGSGLTDKWFEFACAGTALAHTDLTGLVDPDEPPPVHAPAPSSGRDRTQDVRTAALRMFRAQYKGSVAQTDTGTPIHYERADVLRCSRSSTPSPGATADKVDSGKSDVGPIEAKWNNDGAVCIDHSRLWMRDSLVPEAGSQPGDIASAEPDFVKQFGQPCNSLDPKTVYYFVSKVVHHIQDYSLPGGGGSPPVTAP